MTTEIPYKPLGLIKEFLEKSGYSIAHCYEDLIFLEHNAFLLKMESKGEDVSLIFNSECETETVEEISRSLPAAALQFGLRVIPGCTYTLAPNEEENTINIEFNT